jgi:holo-[acyl-carrier protein] synthase
VTKSALSEAFAQAGALSAQGALAAGCDLVYLPDFKDLALPRFLERAFTLREVRDTLGRSDSLASLAARWAAKEAAYKAFSQLAVARGLDPLGLAVFRHYEVVSQGRGPQLRLHGRPLAITEELRVQVSLSLTHDGEYSAAFVVLGLLP